jgi:hypothetical protein
MIRNENRSLSNFGKPVEKNPPLYNYETETWSIFSVKNKRYVELTKGIYPQNYYGIKKTELALFFKEGYRNYPSQGRDLESWCAEDYTLFCRNVSEGKYSENKDKPPLYDDLTRRWAYYNNKDKKYYGNFSKSPDIYYELSIEELSVIFKNSYDGLYKGRGGNIESTILTNYLNNTNLDSNINIATISSFESTDEQINEFVSSVNSFNQDNTSINGIDKKEEEIKPFTPMMNFKASEEKQDIKIVGNEEEMIQIPKSLFDALMKAVGNLDDFYKTIHKADSKK